MPQGIGGHDDDASRGVGIGAAMGLQRAEKRNIKRTRKKRQSPSKVCSAAGEKNRS